MRDPYLIIERPLMSEKAMDLGSVGKYTFRVSKESNKIEIALAVETIFKLDPGTPPDLRASLATSRPLVT